MADRIHAISMPKWGMTMTEGRVAGWLVGEGDAIRPGIEVVEIETSKITNVMDTPASGVLRRRLIDVGATAPVGSLLAVVAEPDVSDGDIDAFIGAYVVAAPDEGEGAEGPRPRLVDAGGRAINVLTMGAGDAMPLVLLHGFGGDLNSWLFNQPEFAKDRAVHALDLPGHGGSDLDPGAGSATDLAAAIAVTIDALGLGIVHLAGHSLGGAVAAQVAASHAGRVASLLLVAPVGLGPGIDAGYIQAFLAAERRRPMQEALGRLFADPALVTRQMADEALQSRRRDGAAQALGAIAGANFAGGRQSVDVRTALALQRIPVLIVWGARDGIIPPAHADGLPASVAVQVIEDAGHMPHMEQAQRFNALARAFLAKADAG